MARRIRMGAIRRHSPYGYTDYIPKREYDELDFKYKRLLKEWAEIIIQSETELNEVLERADRLEAERNELKKRMEKMKYDFDFINSDRNLLKEENSKLKTKIEESIECGADCGECKNKCRAWQNGFNAKGSSKGYELIKAYIETTSTETDGEVIAHIEGIIEALECDTE